MVSSWVCFLLPYHKTNIKHACFSLYNLCTLCVAKCRPYLHLWALFHNSFCSRPTFEFLQEWLLQEKEIHPLVRTSSMDFQTHKRKLAPEDLVDIQDEDKFHEIHFYKEQEVLKVPLQLVQMREMQRFSISSKKRHRKWTAGNHAETWRESEKLAFPLFSWRTLGWEPSRVQGRTRLQTAAKVEPAYYPSYNSRHPCFLNHKSVSSKGLAERWSSPTITVPLKTGDQ